MQQLTQLRTTPLGCTGLEITRVGSAPGDPATHRPETSSSTWSPDREVQILAFSEGVLLTEQGGIDRHVALQMMTHSAIGSPVLQARTALLPELPGAMWP